MDSAGVGIIGLGMGRSQLQAFRDNPLTRVVGICDTDEARLRDVAEQVHPDVATVDYRDLMARDDISIICVASPDPRHREHSVAALEAGKHVFCEKPLALDYADCEAIVRAADRAPGVFMIGQVCRFAPGFVAAKRLIEQGTIGDLFLVESEYAHDYTHVGGTGGWRKDPKRHPVIGGGCHAVDLLRWMAGNAHEVCAFANHKVLTDWPVDDCTVAILRFGNDIIGRAMVSIGCKRDYTMRSCFYGTKGTIICDNTSTHITLHTQDTKRIGLPALGDPQSVGVRIPVGSQAKPVAAEVDHFVHLVTTGAANEMDAREGARTVATCLAIVESSRAGGRPAAVRNEF
ncbi:MAG TPA: Gfo/Idh/MocA family oxidoreductase [Armatimonadota bacterium]|nr:Gfo/Idh/MocA family oxidoreductase [Armatimonadota bacterium]HQK95883.1 Gfo/Idh/MocA family oxidoreductase [Armatimonadota bacterium]